MGEIQIQYQGFHPSDFTQAQLDEVLAEIQLRAPTDAHIRAAFRRQKKILTASVHILSAAGDFFAKASGQHVSQVTRQLSERLQRRLSRWKTLRTAKGRHLRLEEDLSHVPSTV